MAAEATCRTCPLSSPWTPAGDGKERVLCHRAGAEAEEGEAARYATWWCSEHPLLQRDRLAAMAMQGLLAHHGLPRFGEPFAPNWNGPIAAEAYALADAMLAEREKGASR